jgi:hypothetical protein
MKPSIKFKTTTSLLIILFALGFFALLQRAQAVLPAPDGGYPGGSTAEGQNALFSLTSGGYNTAVGFFSLRSDTTGSFNTAVGAGTLLANTADDNTATGVAALLSNTGGFQNTANGAFALFSNNGVGNTAAGYFALLSNTTGNFNTAVGHAALSNNTTGNYNIAVGFGAGSNLTTGDNNIDIGYNVFGVADETNTIRIGNDNITTTIIRGISGATVTGGVPVYVNSGGVLGTMTSSARFKDEIKSMDKGSEAILALKPVTFCYKNDNTNTPQFGLIAEEVAEVDPDLVVRDKDGEIYTVRYDAVNAMLLNEFLKEHQKVEKLEAAAMEQQKAIKALTASLKEQASQIQKVSADIEVSKPTPRMVANEP